MLLYIHIPFCDSKCSYCAFNSYVDKFSLRQAYMDAILHQLTYELQRFNVSPQNPIETVFIGGGTPSTIDPSMYRPIFELIAPYLSDGCEITSEANPNSATSSWLGGMFELGVNRLSFGVQSFNNEKLKSLGRAHNTEHAIQAIQSASTIGYQHLSIDLIYAVAGDTKALLETDIAQAFSLPIDHISLYALTIEEKTAFEKTPQIAQEELELTQWLFDEIRAQGFDHYEISNFGKYRSRHNLGYWEHKDYIGIGSGAVGFFKDRRFYPSASVETYIHNPLEIYTEIIESDALISEKLFLGFRSAIGVDETILNPKQKQKALMLCDEKLLIHQNNRFFNTNFLLADEIALSVEGF